MTVLRELMSANAGPVLAFGGLGIGAMFGALVQATGFCTMGAIADRVLLADGRRLRAWALAIAVALLATQGMAAAGVVALDKSLYLAPSLNWLGHLAGGALLGFGMVFTGGCPSRCLARAGGGDLRSLVVLIITGIAAFVAIGGVLGPARVALDRALAIDLRALGAHGQGLGDLLAAGSGLAPPWATLAATVVVAGALLGLCLVDRRFRVSAKHVGSGLGVGLLVAAGWCLTGLAYDDLAVAPIPPASLTFVRPAGDTLEWLQRATALGWPGFGASTVLGALLGACAAATASGQFHLATFSSANETALAMMGAVLMGIGGVLALGCTVGQGISGASTLALGAYLTLAAIIAGCVAGLRALERWS